eukprot:UN07607
MLLPPTYLISRSKLRRERSNSLNSQRRRKTIHDDMVKQLLWLLASIAALVFILGVTVTIASVINRMSGGVKFLGVPTLALWRLISAV